MADHLETAAVVVQTAVVVVGHTVMVAVGHTAVATAAAVVGEADLERTGGMQAGLEHCRAWALHAD